MTRRSKPDHGGGIDAAMARYGGSRSDWLDLSTGINPVPYSIPDISQTAWNTLPDQAASDNLVTAARLFWNIPDKAEVLAAPGASSLIARIPALAKPGSVIIKGPTYNEHAAAFDAHGWPVNDGPASTQVIVHPNNPDGHLWQACDLTTSLSIIDESFCDVTPDATLINLAARPGTLVLKSFGKFWGLAGLRLGFAIGDPALISALAGLLGPWPVSGPALTIGAQALHDTDWARQTRNRLATDAARLDHLMQSKDAALVGGTHLFRLYKVDNAARWQDQLAQHHIWSRIFPYSDHWIRLGLPAPDRWPQLAAAL